MGQTRKTPRFVTMWIVVTLCIASLWLFRRPLTWNETSRLPVAKHFVDPSWIPNDWFLNNSDLYQIPFNCLAAPFLTFFDLGTATLLIRLLLHAWFASGLVALAKRLNIGLLPLIPATLFTVSLQLRSLAADEWMVGRAETKTLAYGAVLWAFSALFGKRFLTTGALLGLATSFHVLIGLYATIAVALFVLTHPTYWREFTGRHLAAFPLYLTTGAFGFFIIFQTLIYSDQGGSFSNLVYIARNRMHLWPPSWWEYSHLDFPGWIEPYAWQFRAVMALLFLGTVSVWVRIRPLKEFAHLALLSALSFGAGLLIFALGQYDLLKYYPFRFPDAMIPFASFLLFFALWEAVSRNSDDSQVSPKIIKHLRLSLCLFVGLAALYGGSRTVKHLHGLSKKNIPWQFIRLSPEERESTQWIRDNTSSDAMFLVDPYFEEFYLTAERGVMVAWKHLPSGNTAFVEWHARLMAVNGGQEVLTDTMDLDRNSIQRSFNEMSFDDAQTLARVYDLDHYYGPFREDWAISPVFRSGDKAVYRLP